MEAKETSQPKKATEVHKQSLNPSLESSDEPMQCPTKEHTSRGEAMDQKLTQDTSQSMLLKELQLEQHLNSNMSKSVQSKCLNSVSISKTDMLAHDAGKTNLSSKHPEHEKPNMCDKLKHIPKSLAIQNENVPNKELITIHSNSMKAGQIKQTLLPKPHVLKFVYRETLLSFTNLTPVLPSEIPCHFQDFRSVVPRKKSCDLLLPSCAIERPIAFEKANIETIRCDIRNKQGKEIIVADAIIPRYVFLFIPEAKLLELEHIRMLYDSNDNFKNVFPSCEEFEHKKFFRHGGFLFDKTSEPNKNFVLMDIASFFNSASASPNDELFFREIVYFDSTLNFSKHLDDHAEHLKFVLNDLSGNLFASRNEHILGTYDLFSRVFAVSIQDIQIGELSFHAPKMWLYHVWLKKNVVLEPMKHLRKEQQVNQRRCRMIFEPGGNLWSQLKNGRLPNQTKINLMSRSDYPFQISEPINKKAYKKSLQGEYNLSLIFNFSNLIIFLAECSDLRSNPFQVGEDDMIMAITKKMELEPELVAEEAKHEPAGSNSRKLQEILRRRTKSSMKIRLSPTTIFDPGISRQCLSNHFGFDSS